MSLIRPFDFTAGSSYSGRCERRAGLFSGAAFIAIALLTFWRDIWTPMFQDTSMWMRIARNWHAGLIPYRDSYDIKQPFLFLYYRLVDSPHPKISIFVIGAVLAACSAWLWRNAARAIGLPLAWLAPALWLVACTAGPTYWGGQTTELPASIFSIASLALCLLAFPPRRAWLMPLSGLAFFMAVQMRVTAVTDGVMFAVLFAIYARQAGIVAAVFRLAWQIAGFAAGALALYLDARIEGYWTEYLLTYGRNIGYVSDSAPPFVATAFHDMGVAAEMLAYDPVMLVLAALSVWLLWLRPRGIGGGGGIQTENTGAQAKSLVAIPASERAMFCFGLLWLATSFVGTLPGGRGFPHYFQMLWAPLALMAAAGLSAASREAHQRAMCRAFAILAVAVPAGAMFVRNATAFVRERNLVQAAESHYAWIDEAQAFIDKHVPPGEVLGDCTLGPSNELLWRSPRPLVSRLVEPRPFIDLNTHREIIDEWFRALEQHPPRWFMLSAGEITPKRLATFVAGHYTRQTQIGDVAFYLLNGALP